MYTLNINNKNDIYITKEYNENKYEENNNYKLYFDGCSKNNPGKASCAAVLYNEKDEEIWNDKQYLGNNKTNNYAEYNGLILGLKKVIELNIENLEIYGDSKLVINQINKIYSVKSDKIFILYNITMNLLKKIKNYKCTHILREYNKRADELANNVFIKKLK